jgi:plastocyanin
MVEKLKPGTKVRWNSYGGNAHGKVVKTQVTPTKIKGHTVAATPQEPQYIVETDEGKRAGHKPAALHRD